MTEGLEPIDNTADVIDSREVIARIDYLSTDVDSLTDDERAELAALQAFAEQGDTLADWIHGETLIRDSYFEDYARELADDIGAVPADASWPAYCIDWERAARDLKMDYTPIDFGDVTYWGRS